jgi:sugar lactone lactonase YvrE
MKLHSHLAVVAVTSIAVVLGGPVGVAQADRGHDHDHGHAARTTKVFTLDPSTHGNPEGVAWDRASGAFFVGATGDGTIYRGTLGNPTATEFITFPVSDGRSSVGMKVRDGLLYVAGGATGNIYVYDLATKATVATFATGSGGFLNDLVVTRRGDVYVTDSFRPTIWHVTDAQVQADTGTPGAISVAPDIEFVGGGAFNLNGIVALEHGKDLVVVNSANGKLFRVALTHDGAAARSITEVSGLGDSLLGGDGMIVDRGRLVVVIGDPAALKFVKLRHHRTRGEVRDVRTDATLKGPSTVARADDRYLVVNADFATSTTPFTVSGLSRGGDDHSGHGDDRSGHGPEHSGNASGHSGNGSGHSGHSG